MSDMWSAAAAVPVWTRPQPGGGFHARAAEPDPPPAGFSPWSDPRPDLMPEADAPHPATAIDLDRLAADAFTQGFEEGRRTVALEVAAERTAIRTLAASLENLRPEAPQALAAMLAETVKRLVGGIVGRVAIDDATLLAQTRAAAALIAEETAPARLRLHPDDRDRLAGAPIAADMVADPALRPGMVVAETATGWIEDGPEVRLERLRQTLDRTGMLR